MPNLTQQALDDAIAQAVATALATDRAKRDRNRGALWISKADSKSSLSGKLHVECPHCNEVTDFAQCAYETGADGTDKRPVYRTSIFVSDED